MFFINFRECAKQVHRKMFYALVFENNKFFKYNNFL